MHPKFWGASGLSARDPLNVLFVFQPLPWAMKKIWENLGKTGRAVMPLYLGPHAPVMSNCCHIRTSFPTKSCSGAPCHTRYAHLNPKISIASHEIPWHFLCIERRDGQTKRRGGDRPRTRRKKTGSYRQPPSSDDDKEIRRASEQTSPPGGKRVGRPAMGQWADRVVAATRSAFSIFRGPKPQSTEPQGQWRVRRSEASSTKR